MSLGMDKPIRLDKTSFHLTLPNPDKPELNIDD
jgi:hypothetical protein